MAFSQSINPNVFEKHNRVLFLPSSWNRLMSLIKYQVPNGGFAVMEGDYGAGKTSFAKIFEKKLVLDESIDCQIIQVHPLSTIQQINAQLPKEQDHPLLVIVDDAHEASTLLLQKLAVTKKNLYWLLMAEPGLEDRVEDFSERKVDLPLFSKSDCFEFLQKQLNEQPKYAQFSQIQSDTIWYSSQGLPKDIVHYAKKNMDSLFSGQASNENFDKANKSWYMTAALGAAAVILIILLAVNMGADEADESPAGSIERGEISIDQTINSKATQSDLDRGMSQDVASSKPSYSDVSNEAATSRDLESARPDALSESNQSKSEDDNAEQDLNELNVNNEEPQSANTNTTVISQEEDPIESIALQVAKQKPSSTTSVQPSQSFNQWLASHSGDSYSLQLFSHSEKAAADKFQSSLDLADSYVYQAKVNGDIRYRVLWGAFDTRAKAQQAIESLPPKLLEQKPWIRQFTAIAREVTK